MEGIGGLELLALGEADDSDGGGGAKDGAISTMSPRPADPAKSNLVVWLLWTLCKAKVDGVQLFSTYITQLLAAGLVEPTEEVVQLCRTGDFSALASDLYEAVPGAKDWNAQPVPRGVPTALGIPTSPTKMLQHLQASSLADPWASTQYKEMFEEYEELGRGGFGSIARVRHRADLKFYAAKKIRCRLPKQQLDERGGLDAYLHSRILREAQVICQMDHPHIVRYYNTWVEVRWGTAQTRRGAQRSSVPRSPRGGGGGGGAKGAAGGVNVAPFRASGGVDLGFESASETDGTSVDETSAGGSSFSFGDTSISSGPASAGGLISVTSSSKDASSPMPCLKPSRSPVPELNSQSSSNRSLTLLRVEVDEDSGGSSSSAESAATSIDSDYSAVSINGGAPLNALAPTMGTDIVVRQNHFDEWMRSGGDGAGAAALGGGAGGNARTNGWVENLDGIEEGAGGGGGHMRALSGRQGQMLVRAAASQGGGLGAMIAGGFEGNVEIYIQMELCHAHSLADRLRLGPGGGYGPYTDLQATGTLDMLQQLVSAVGYLHARGVVHRDIKPANIMFALDAHGGETGAAGGECVKLGDFGLAAYSVQDEATADAKPAAREPEPEPEPEPEWEGTTSDPLGQTDLWDKPSNSDRGRNGSGLGAGDARIEVLDEMSSFGSGGQSYISGSGSSSSGSNVGGMSSSQHGGGGVGTTLYAAPEQLGNTNGGGSASAAHAPADVYSLGVTICEVVAGFYTASERMLSLRALTARSDAAGAAGCLPRNFAPDLPALGELVLDMVKQKPEERPTISQVASRLAEMQVELAGQKRRRKKKREAEAAVQEAAAAREMRVDGLVAVGATAKGSVAVEEGQVQAVGVDGSSSSGGDDDGDGDGMDATIGAQRRTIELLRAQLRKAGLTPEA